jgi:hypothetical protein
MMASAGVQLPLSCRRITYTAAGRTIPAGRLWVELLFARTAGEPSSMICLLDTGAPLSVIPWTVHRAYGLAWQPLPGPWPPGFTTWSGVPCTVGCLEVWAPVPGAALLRGPLLFIAKFAQAMPANLPATLPVLVGLNFLADHLAETHFQCHTPPHAGSVVLP